jgi:aspartyl protease family protein
MNNNGQQNPGRPAGLGMLIASFVIGIGLLTLYFDGVLDRQMNPNQRPVSQVFSDGITEVVLQRNRQGHYVAGGTLNGVRGTFLLDTGATDVVIPQGLARRADLPQGQPIQAMTANGVVTVYTTTVAELELGDIRLYNVRASINPAMHGDTVLLGMSALRHVEFTQRGDALTLRQYPD